MVTGYDHLLFLFGVNFFLYRVCDMLRGRAHITLFAGVLGGVHVNPYLVGPNRIFWSTRRSINLDGFRTLFGWEPNPKRFSYSGSSTDSASPPSSKTLRCPPRA